MIQELDSSEIIAFCVKQKRAKKSPNTLSIPYEDIRVIGNKMEKAIPSLLVTSDMVSIDAFRCEFKNHVTMEKRALKIQDVNAISTRISRYLPPENILSTMKKVATSKVIVK